MKNNKVKTSPFMSKLKNEVIYDETTMQLDLLVPCKHDYYNVDIFI